MSFLWPTLLVIWWFFRIFQQLDTAIRCIGAFCCHSITVFLEAPFEYMWAHGTHQGASKLIKHCQLARAPFWNDIMSKFIMEISVKSRDLVKNQLQRDIGGAFYLQALGNPNNVSYALFMIIIKCYSCLLHLDSLSKASGALEKQWVWCPQSKNQAKSTKMR